MKNTFRRAAVIGLAAAMSGSVLPAGSAFAAGGSGSEPALVSYDVNGNGTVESGEKAYRITTADQLDWFSQHVNAGNPQSNAFLANNIDMNGRTSTDTYKPIKYFNGFFDGNGYAIRSLYLDYSEPASYSEFSNSDLVGLFGHVYDGGEIRNLSLYGTMLGPQIIGAFVGQMTDGKLYNCNSYVDVIQSPAQSYENEYTYGNAYGCGGFIGEARNSFIEQCSNYGNVLSYDCNCNICPEVGGIVGHCNKTEIRACFNYGQVQGCRYVGGICGYAFNTAAEKIEECGNEGHITGLPFSWDDYAFGVGGLIGWFDQGTLENCYNAADVCANPMRRIGGIVGIQSATISLAGENRKSVKNCYNYGRIYGKASEDMCWTDPIGFSVGSNNTDSKNCYYLYYPGYSRRGMSCKNLTEEEFAKKENFVGFDFTNVWYMNNALHRPVLRSATHIILQDKTSILTSNCSEGDYFIRSKANNRYLDLAASSYTTLISHDFNAGNNQKFHYSEGCMTSFQNGKYITIGADYSGGYKGFVQTDMSGVACIREVNTDSVRILKAFCVYENGNTTTKYYALEVRNPELASSIVFWNEYQPNNQNQLWKFENATSVTNLNNSVFNLQNANSGLLLDMYTANGNLLQHAANGGDNQKWQIISAGNGRYLLKTTCAAHPGYIGCGSDNRATVVANEVAVEMFDNGDGTFRIHLPGTNKFLRVANDSMGSAIVKWEPYTGTGGFHWKTQRMH